MTKSCSQLNYLNSNTNENSNIENHKENSNEKKEEKIISDIKMEKILTLLYQLIVKNANKLIIDNQTDLFMKNFCINSDIVTILNSLYEFSNNPTEFENKSGFSLEFVDFIYKSLENEFDLDGRQLIISAIDRFNNSKQNMLKLIDSFIINDLNIPRGCFFKIDVTNTENNPILIYKYKNSSNVIKFSKRPGIRRFDNPRNIIILSKYNEKNEEFDHGVLLHRDYDFNDNDFGVTCYPYYYTYENFYSSFNFFFFNYLFEAYWKDRQLYNDFLIIENNTAPNKNIKSIFHITKFEKECYIIYCPRNESIQKLSFDAIKACIILLTVFPNSIIFKIDNPLCAIDFIGNGNLNQYTTKIYIINENNPELPIPFPLNKTTLEFAVFYSHLLHRSDSPLRFSITGENFYYKKCSDREIEAKFSNPNINDNIPVFDPQYPSHLVLLIDQNFKDRPKNVTPLSWLPNSKTVFNSFEKNLTQHNFYDKSNEMVLNISSQILNDFGKIEESSDLFFITLSNAFLVVSEGTIPEYIYNFVRFSQKEGNVLKNNIHHLIKQLSKGFEYKQKLTEPILLESISSTDNWTDNHIKDERIDVLNEILIAIKNHFHINEENISVQFLGSSLILLKIKNLPESLTRHQIITDIWNDEYQPCKADEEIKTILNKIKNIDLQVTEVIHEKSIRIKVFHKKNYGIDKNEFMNRLNQVINKFGFLKQSITDYIIESNQNEIIGSCDIELINILSSKIFASEIIYAFKSNNCRKIKAANKTVSIIPLSNDVPIKDMIYNIKEINKYSTCLSVCDEPQTYLSQCLYAYHPLYFVEAHIMCKECIIQTFKNMTDFQNAINPETHMIDQMKITKIYNLLPGFLSINNNYQSFNQSYPIIPFGQGIWTILSCDNLISHYIKMWFSININVLIRTSPRYFVCCPLHNDAIFKSPKDDDDIICPQCNLFYHSKCHNWHFKNDECMKLKENEKYCPNCFLITEKISGCSHISCRCRKHWCFKCDKSPIFDSPLHCYEHMKNIHNESYVFIRYIYHIYLNKQNEKEIVRIDIEKLTLKICVPIHVLLFIHDHQDDSELHIYSYDEKNLINKCYLKLPLILEKVYDYDIVQNVNEIRSVIDNNLIIEISKYFDYSIKKDTIALSDTCH